MNKETVSEEQVLFNKLRWEEQELIIRIMKSLQPCEIKEEPRDIEVCGSLFTKSEYDKLAQSGEEKKIPEKLTDILRVDDLIPPVDENMYKIWIQTIKNHNKINSIIDYLKSKGE